MALDIRCRCGQLHGTMDPSRVYARGTCHCRDCQAFARYLGGEGLMDGNGGTDVLPMAPSGIAITFGNERLACMSLGPNGLLRWYSACCRTPLPNTSRNARTPYAGLCTACLAGDEATLSRHFGPRDRVMLNVKSATGDVPPARLALLKGGLAILAGMLRERLAGRARPPSVFFDAQGHPEAPVDVIPLERRRQLSMPA